MAHVKWLNSLIRSVAETRKVSAARLESRKWLRKIVLREIVVARQMLILTELVVNFDGELIAPLMSQRHSLELRTSVLRIWEGHELVKQVQSRLVETRFWNDATGENNGVI